MVIYWQILVLHLVSELYRKHRLIEAFLVHDLGYTTDQIHEEAEVLEHTVSELFVERLGKNAEFPRNLSLMAEPFLQKVNYWSKNTNWLLDQVEKCWNLSFSTSSRWIWTIKIFGKTRFTSGRYADTGAIRSLRSTVCAQGQWKRAASQLCYRSTALCGKYKKEVKADNINTLETAQCVLEFYPRKQNKSGTVLSRLVFFIIFSTILRI